MSDSLLTSSGALEFAAAHVRRHGARGIGLLIVLLVVVVVVVILVQRRRDRRPVHDATPPRVGASMSSAATNAEIGDDEGVLGGARATIVVPTMATGEPVPEGRYSLAGLVRAEWTKLRTVRSTMWTLTITVIMGIGISALAAGETRAHWSSMGPGSQLSFDPVSTSLAGLFIAQFSIGVLGALCVSAEYGTGTIRATFSAAPQRVKVMVAKVVVFGLVALVVSEFVSFVSFFLGQALLTSPATHASITSPGALRAVVGAGLFVTLLGVIALALAVIIRYGAGAISAYVGILLILPLLMATLPSSISQNLRRFLPDRIGAVMLTTRGPLPSGVFSPWIGMMIMCLYALVLLGVGGVLLNRRDA